MIPHIFHFIYFTPYAAPAKVFPLSYYLAIKSAINVNQPQEVIFHFDREPVGEWWEKITPFITLHKMEAPNTFMSSQIIHPAHKADIVRLLLLKETGGIYLDLDTICVKPLTCFLDSSFVIGWELKAPYTPKNWRQQLKFNIRKQFGFIKPIEQESVFCNGVLLAEKNSEFVNCWINEYKTFRSKGRDKYWNEHSSVVPQRLANEHPQLITIVDPYSFHYPLYTKAGLKSMFEEVTTFPQSFIHHVWESFSWNDYLSKLSSEQIRKHDTTYNLIARKFLEP